MDQMETARTSAYGTKNLLTQIAPSEANLRPTVGNENFPLGVFFSLQK